jgi:membrane fusion protein (multidrug efflux system)
MNVKKISAGALLLLTAGGMLMSCSGNSAGDTKEGKGAAPNPKNQVSPVTAYVVKTTQLDNSIVSSGTVLANNEVDLRSEVNGRIVKINFTEGSRVTKGSLLVKINDADLQAQLAKSRDLVKVDAGKVDRATKLLAKQGISQEEYDMTVNDLNGAKEDVNLLLAQIAKTEIRAPFNGVIGLRSVSEGAFLTPSTPIATLQEIEPVKIDFAVSEKYMNMVKKGDPIVFTVQGSKQRYKGSIYAIDPKIDLSTRTVMLRAICPNNEDKVLPGSFVKVELILSKIPNAILVPTESIIPILKGETVYLAKDGKAVVQRVETGTRNDSTVEVTSGLQPGDTIVTTGMMSLHPDARIKVTKVR